MPLEYHTYRIGFNGDDETEFDVVPAAQDFEMAELMKLLIYFLKENPNINFESIDYIERVYEESK